MKIQTLQEINQKIPKSQNPFSKYLKTLVNFAKQISPELSCKYKYMGLQKFLGINHVPESFKGVRKNIYGFCLVIQQLVSY